MLSPGNSLKNPDLDIDKKLKKLTQTVLLLMPLLFMNLIYSNKDIV